MFTGIVEELGVVESISKSTKSAKITINADLVLKDTKLGDSICTNGVCLTVTSFTNKSFTVDVMAETMRQSNLKSLTVGNNVNLERALRAQDRLGGHFVSGHIDGTGTIVNYEKEDNAVWITVAAESNLLKYIVERGSIAIDGVSLTVPYVDSTVFKVSIIPHTNQNTTLLKKQVGDEVNLECDILGKYIEKFLSVNQPSSKKSNIDLEFLGKHGFI